jgi:hypothetical protein
VFTFGTELRDPVAPEGSRFDGGSLDTSDDIKVWALEY